MESRDLERIMDEYGDSVLRLCYMYLKDKDLAEDATQETFIKVYQRYYTLKDVSYEKTWIMRIAINTCKTYMKTSWIKRVITGISLERVVEGNIESHIIKKEQEKQLYIEISKLDMKYKEVILLHYYQEIPTKQVAEILGLKEGTVRVRLQRAREKLSITLQEVDS